MEKYPEHEALVQALLDWFAVHMRPLPWRRDYDPYQVWISEIMLQQTQMERGVAYFERWMRQFPTVADVAAAELEEVLKAWEGLGYYSRVRNLHAAAKKIVAVHGGAFPMDTDAIRALPGVGPYTAGAIASIAFNRAVPAVDANVERVFSRLFDIDAPVKSTAAADFIVHMAAGLMPEGRAREWNQALMELGALVCGKKPRCEICPLIRFCRAFALGIAHERPVPGRKVHYSALQIACGVLVHRGRLFIQKRLDSGVWAGFWEFPGGRIEEGESPEEAAVREYCEETEFAVRVIRPLGVVRHAYTRYRIAMHCFLCAIDGKGAEGLAWAASSGKKTGGNVPLSCLPAAGAQGAAGNGQTGTEQGGFPAPVLHAATEYRWACMDDLARYTFPAGHRKLLESFGAEVRAAVKEA